MSLMGKDGLPASLKSYVGPDTERSFTPSTPTTKPKRALKYESGPGAQTKVIKTDLTEPDDGMKVHPLLMYPSTPDRDCTNPPARTPLTQLAALACRSRCVLRPHSLTPCSSSPHRVPVATSVGVTPVVCVDQTSVTCIVLHRMSTTRKMAVPLRNHSRTVVCSPKIHPFQTHRHHCRQVDMPRT